MPRATANRLTAVLIVPVPPMNRTFIASPPGYEDAGPRAGRPAPRLLRLFLFGLGRRHVTGSTHHCESFGGAVENLVGTAVRNCFLGKQPLVAVKVAVDRLGRL